MLGTDLFNPELWLDEVDDAAEADTAVTIAGPSFRSVMANGSIHRTHPSTASQHIPERNNSLSNTENDNFRVNRNSLTSAEQTKNLLKF